MRELILRFIKKLSIKTILKEVSSKNSKYLDYYYLDYLDAYGSYCNLTLIYNEQIILPIGKIDRLGKGAEITYLEELKSHVKVYGSKKQDYTIGSKGCIEKLESFINYKVDEFKENLFEEVLSVKIEGVLFTEVYLYTKPVFILKINYAVNKIVSKPLIIYLEDLKIDKTVEEVERRIKYEGRSKKTYR